MWTENKNAMEAYVQRAYKLKNMYFTLGCIFMVSWSQIMPFVQKFAMISIYFLKF